MLNKMVLLMLVGMVTVTAVPALAATHDEAAKPLTAVNVVANQNVKIQVAHVASEANQYNSGSVQTSTTAPPTGWLLGLALLGFVMLSNRSGV
ncbi:hypothetical protein [Methylotenera sp.]|uniref:hypothetical protein n=1 Tax=Methylotenera sp. TaxID=2051956 RepID=UPI00271AAC55|nr:hypothetical protein [Methylotenera sp.]MDO9204630.1 hypothetical protein [Methylotenera sp.]MDO9393358.1 hypothetical protein [Methylotenera sp.]MDP1524046.1 hypothetical protein [Methylotenera sp.]MDP2071241.1 hypothetical protein [Methylotenera sp.]MDP3005158.1 hypothetical protein [Methylotenera sp.]